MNNELQHYGVPKRSGRYPWGSGDRPYQGDVDKAIKKERKEAAKKRRQLDVDELKKRIEKIDLERRLLELTEKDVSPGKVKVKLGLEKIGTAVVIGGLTAAGLAGFKKIGKASENKLSEAIKKVKNAFNTIWVL